jgi:hypothetical protein
MKNVLLAFAVLISTLCPRSVTASAPPIGVAAVDLRQNGPISVTGTLCEGGTVYLAIPVKNYGGSTSPAMHVYSEGYTAKGQLWRADGAQPTAVGGGGGGGPT